MKIKHKEKQPERPARTVKINDELHHRIRVMAVIERTGMQTIMERLLEAGLKALK
jgi:hypothetical protein